MSYVLQYLIPSVFVARSAKLVFWWRLTKEHTWEDYDARRRDNKKGRGDTAIKKALVHTKARTVGEEEKRSLLRQPVVGRE